VTIGLVKAICRSCWRWVGTVLFCIALWGCVSAATRRDLAETRFREGEAALSLHDYRAAAVAYGEVWRLNPTVLLYAKRLGLVLEHLKDYAGAVQVYRSGLALPPPDADLHEEMVHRLALLEAFRTGEAAKAGERLGEIPADSPRAADLRAVLALLRGDGRQALVELNAARSVPLSADLASLVYYHAARAYALVGDKDRAVAMLYEAVNLAEFMPVATDIEEFRVELTGH